MKAVEAITADMWPGIPVIPVMSSGGTDGRFLNNAGIWTYGITGAFQHPGGSNAPGLNEKMPVKSLYEAHEFSVSVGEEVGGIENVVCPLLLPNRADHSKTCLPGAGRGPSFPTASTPQKLIPITAELASTAYTETTNPIPQPSPQVLESNNC